MATNYELQQRRQKALAIEKDLRFCDHYLYHGNKRAALIAQFWEYKRAELCRLLDNAIERNDIASAKSAAQALDILERDNV